MDADAGSLEPLILVVRGQRVMLDADLARLYGVTTKRFNEAFKRNRARFPEDFAYQLAATEAGHLRSQSATSRSQTIDFKAYYQTAAGRINPPHGGRRTRPWVFTEHGALMAANVLRSAHAVRMSVFVIRAFVRLREQVVANATILKRLAEIDKTLLQHDSALRDIYRKLLPLLQPPPASPVPPKRRIGFLPDDA